MSSSGVYALLHRPTKMVYVGSTKDFSERRKDWWHALNTRSPNLSLRMLELSGNREEWDFRVIWSGVATPLELLTIEQRAIAALRVKAPERCLNTATPVRCDLLSITADGRTLSLRGWQKETGVARSTIAFRLRRGWAPAQAVGIDSPPWRDRGAEHELDGLNTANVVVHDGTSLMSRRDAAAAIGCTVHTLAKRLRRQKAPGRQVSVQLADLKAASEKFSRRV